MKKFLSKIKKSIIRKLEKMAEANKKNFGHELDCCSLNNEEYGIRSNNVKRDNN